jgi:ubiquinone/menaquinone biosynthesis C-methylase UbiE
MIRPARLQNAKEHLDEPASDLASLETDLIHIENVNRWLGGWRAAFSAISPWLNRQSVTRILDVGCGSADVPRMIAERAARARSAVWIVAADRSRQILGIAERRTASHPGIRFTQADATHLPFADDAFDIVIMSLALHHFEGAARIQVLHELGRVARRRVLINELERCWPNYVGARLLAATAWRGNCMARHDGPVSVLRSFTRGELDEEMRAAGLTDVSVKRLFFYRLVGSAAPARATAKRAAVSTVA